VRESFGMSSQITQNRGLFETSNLGKHSYTVRLFDSLCVSRRSRKGETMWMLYWVKSLKLFSRAGGLVHSTMRIRDVFHRLPPQEKDQVKLEFSTIGNHNGLGSSTT
jgi:hypothetical protein